MLLEFRSQHITQKVLQTFLHFVQVQQVSFKLSELPNSSAVMSETKRHLQLGTHSEWFKRFLEIQQAVRKLSELPSNLVIQNIFKLQQSSAIFLTIQETFQKFSEPFFEFSQISQNWLNFPKLKLLFNMYSRASDNFPDIT